MTHIPRVSRNSASRVRRGEVRQRRPRGIEGAQDVNCGAVACLARRVAAGLGPQSGLACEAGEEGSRHTWSPCHEKDAAEKLIPSKGCSALRSFILARCQDLYNNRWLMEFWNTSRAVSWNGKLATSRISFRHVVERSSCGNKQNTSSLQGNRKAAK